MAENKRDTVPEYLFNTGTNYRAFDFLGCHFENGTAVFRVWAPNAAAVSVCGDFNGWNGYSDIMYRLGDSGIWECRVENAHIWDAYKYAVTGQNGETHMKSDPFAFHAETAPANASKVYDLEGYEWSDGAWLNKRNTLNIYEQPIN